MSLTYRARQRLKRLGVFLVVLTVVSVLVWLGWLVWMGRYVVYSDEGARFEMDWQSPGEAVLAEPPHKETVSVILNEGETAVTPSRELKQLSGCYITTDMLRNDLETVMTTIRELPKNSTILLDLKNGLGNFAYSTEIPDAPTDKKVDIEVVDRLIEYLNKADFYTIARIPAFRDRAYGLENTKYGLHHTSGMYLWYDEGNCYWLDPTKSGTRSYLSAIAMELRSLGFDEVVFTEFRFPDTQDIIFEGSRLDALNETADYLVENCSTTTFAVSFQCDVEGFALPQGRSRLYRTNVAAGDTVAAAAAAGMEDPQIRLVFLTESMDTRFNAYGVLHPLDTGLDVDVPATNPTGESTEATQEP